MSNVKRISLVFLPILTACAAVYGVLAYRYWSNPPRFSRNFSAELNAQTSALPEADRAWPAYREASIELLRDAPDAWWKRGDYAELSSRPTVREHLQNHRSALDQIRAAARRPHLGFFLYDTDSAEDRPLIAVNRPPDRRGMYDVDAAEVASENPPLQDVLVWCVGHLRELTQVMAADAILAAEEGDAERMQQDLLTILEFARQLRAIPISTCDLGGLTLYGYFLRAWAELLDRHPGQFSVERLRELEQAATSFAGGKLHPRYDGIRMEFLDLIQRVYGDDGRGDGSYFFGPPETLPGAFLDEPISPGKRFFAPLVTLRFPSRRKLVAEFDAILPVLEAESREPYWSADFVETGRRLNALPSGVGYQIIAAHFLGIEWLHAAFENVAQQRAAVTTASALHRFHAARDEWPATLAALVPEYLQETPRDRLTGDVMGYRVVDDRPLLYSRGFDDRDDEGRAPEIDASYRDEDDGLVDATAPWCWSFSVDQHELEGDLVLWPIVDRPKREVAGVPPIGKP